MKCNASAFNCNECEDEENCEAKAQMVALRRLVHYADIVTIEDTYYDEPELKVNYLTALAMAKEAIAAGREEGKP